MLHRTRTLILLTSICLLLGAKAGVSIWQSQTDVKQVEFSTTLTKADMTQQDIKNLPEPSTLNMDVAESLALIGNQIIPQAEAAGMEAEASPQSSISSYDDETLITLRKQKENLDAREKKLMQREKAIEDAEKQVRRRISELEQLEASIQQRLLDEQGIKNKKITRLTAVFEGMKADKAAPVIAQMELPIVVRLFSLMNEKKVGKILSFLPPEKAVSISQALTNKISSIK